MMDAALGGGGFTRMHKRATTMVALAVALGVVSLRGASRLRRHRYRPSDGGHYRRHSCGLWRQPADVPGAGSKEAQP